MNTLWNGVLDVLADRSADEVVWAVFAALALSTVLAGAVALVQRKKQPDFASTCLVVLVASLLSTLLGAGYQRSSYSVRRPMAVAPAFLGPPAVHWPSPVGPDRALAHRMIVEGDRDRDGWLSPEEAARAASEVVRLADKTGKGSVDEDTLRAFFRDRFHSERPAQRAVPPLPPPPVHIRITDL